MSSLDEFLKGAAAVAPDAPIVHTPRPPVDEPIASTEPRGVVEIILPSGIELYFQSDPKRLYRARMHPDAEHEIPEGTVEIRTSGARSRPAPRSRRSSTSPGSCTGQRRAGWRV